MARETARRLALTALGRALAPRERARAAPPERLLLLRPDHLGDVLLASPALAALRAAAPRAELTLAVGPWSEAVARRGVAVDQLLVLPFPGFSRRPKQNLAEPYLLLWQQARRLRRRFDLAVVLRPDHWWGALLAAVAGIPDRLGWDTPTTRPLLTRALPLPSSSHTARLDLALASHAAVLAGGPAIEPGPWGQPRPVFALTDDERAWAAGLAAEAGRPLVLLHPGSGSALKSWPAHRWAAVADALAAAGAAVVLTGGPDDLAGPAAVAAAMWQPALQLGGVTSLGQLGALAERAALVLGTDNGPLHLAAALGTPTLRLYGPTDPARFGPWGPPDDHPILTHQLPCRPCGNLVAPPCGAHLEPPCLLGLETAAVTSAALALLARAAAAPRS